MGGMAGTNKTLKSRRGACCLSVAERMHQALGFPAPPASIKEQQTRVQLRETFPQGRKQLCQELVLDRMQWRANK